MSHGKKPAKLDVDVNSKLVLLRSTQEEKSTQNAQATKKLINIPIGDVIVDTDYEVNVSPSFQVPTSFVRHTKKIGDEADISIDYFMEDEDLYWMRNNPRIAQDRDISTYLGIETFEKIITLLEKHTGFVTDLIIPQIHAERLISDKLKWPAHISSKIVPEVYQYWIKKREKCMKPLCRKYWPSTNASDTNPHHVFRARDKERYRLRKQQRKNDVEAYRKMQQLRREFGRARELLQLVVERETLREVELNVHKEIFELQLCELDAADDSNSGNGNIIDRFGLRKELMSTVTSSSSTGIGTAGTAATVVGGSTETLIEEENQPLQLAPVTAFKLLYPHLLDTPIVPQTKITSDNNSSNSKSSNSGSMVRVSSPLMNNKSNKLQSSSNLHPHDSKLTLNRSSSSNVSNNTTTNIFATGDTNITNTNINTQGGGGTNKNSHISGMMSSIETMSSSNNDVNAHVEDTSDRMKDRKGDKKQKRKLNALNNNSGNFASTAADGTTNVVNTNVTGSDGTTNPAVPVTSETTPVSPFPAFVHYPGMPGPAKLCRPLWPSFMADTDGCRERVTYAKSYLEYLNEVELRHPLQKPLGGISGVSCQSRNLGANKFDCPELMNDDIYDNSISGVNNSNNSNNENSINNNSGNNGNLYPRTFRTRGRIGRGGRYVMDRIPIYAEETQQERFVTATATSTSDSVLMPSTTATSNQHSTTTTTGANSGNNTFATRNTRAAISNSNSGGRRMTNKTKFVYASRIPPYEKPHKGLGVELMMQSQPYGDNNNSHNNINSGNNSNNVNGGSSSGGMVVDGNGNKYPEKSFDDLTSSTTGVVNRNNGGNNAINSNNNNTNKTTKSQMNTSFPVAMPMSRGSLPVSLKQREKEIYNCSDSEDEVVVEYNNNNNNSNNIVSTVTTRSGNKKAKHNTADSKGSADGNSNNSNWRNNISLMSKYCLRI